ncbi:MAG: GAF domain-containing sensor histidine kinase [Streptosporangiaceae bacterium]
MTIACADEPRPGPDEDQVLYQVSRAVLAVTRQLSVRDVLQVIVRSARSLSGARYAALGVPDAQGSFAEFVVDGISARQQKAIGPLPRQHGMLAVLLKEGKPQRLADIRTDPRFEGWWPSAHPDLADFLGVPIKDGPEVLGIIFVANKTTPGGFTARDEQLLGLFAAHAAIALINARLYERVGELSVMEERARLARELHDAVSQKLFSIRAKARAASVLASRDPARAAAEMDSVAALTGAAHAELRAVISGLAPPDLSECGLAESLRRYAGLAGLAHGVTVRFSAARVPPLGAARDAAAYRVAQEALHNALRHSAAGQIEISVTRTAAQATVEVTDDGQGFTPDAPGAGLGLTSMRQRAAEIGATLSITSSPGAGTTVKLEIPIEPGSGR